MSDTNLSVVLHKKGDLRLDDRAIPEPGPGQVQIRMKSVGICGSDVHFWTDGSLGGKMPVLGPMLLGHECSGTITELGQGVEHLHIGDRVAVEPGVPCKRCTYCKTGQYNLCPEVRFLAVYPTDGSLARYHVHEADFCFKLPDNVSDDEGALLEPLSVAIHACRRANICLGHKVLICGAGPIGMVNMITAKAMGAAEVYITDISEHRLKVAKEIGATGTFHVTSKDFKETAQRVTEVMGGMADVTIECSGAEAGLQTTILATKTGGLVMLVGVPPEMANLPISDAAVREVDIRSILRYCNTYPTAISMVASGALDLKPLITHHFTLEQSLEAFETARTGSGGAIKVMIHCNKDWKL